MIRKACEAYLGTTPRDYEELTPDQLLIMLLPIDHLKEAGGGTIQVDLAEAKRLGLLKQNPNSKFANLPPGPSLVQRIRAANKLKADQAAQQAAKAPGERQKARERRAAERQARSQRRNATPNGGPG